MLVNGYPILYEKRTIFFSEGGCQMMLFLLHDITNDHIPVSETVAEARVFVPPTFEVREVRIRFQPPAAVCLDFLHKNGERQGGRYGHEDMDVIGHPSYAVGLAVETFRDTV